MIYFSLYTGDPLAKIGAAILSDFVAMAICYPAHTISKRMQRKSAKQIKIHLSGQATLQKISIGECIKEIYLTQGIFGFYKGFFFNVVCIPIYSFVYAALFEFWDMFIHF